MDKKIIDPDKWHINATPEEIAAIQIFDTREPAGLKRISQPDQDRYLQEALQEEAAILEFQSQLKNSKGASHS